MSKTIFLSYARGDDESFVARLHADLTTRGFDVWWDRLSMPARGLTFLHEIRDAINARERFLLVLGPKATTSDYVVAEWQHAVTNGKPMNPILRIGDYPLLPDDLKLHHVEDFRDDARYAFHLENLVRQLSESVAPMGKLVGVPGLPRHLLKRSGRLKLLKDSMLADLQRPVVVTGATARVGVHGMGGIGKSVLANLLARDTTVRRAFPDGIVWVSLGTSPNLVELQRYVAKAFVEEPGHFDNVAQGRAKLTELLSEKAVLLMMDDVWEPAHAEAFSVLGSRCRAVITTRDAGLVTSLGGTQHQVHLLTDAEALALLGNAAILGPGALPSEAKEIVRECGRLPLAVALCAGMFRRGVSWSSILQRLRQAALESIADRNAVNEQHRSLWTAMKISLDALTREEQRRFIELSVFPNGEFVPEAAVRTLWSRTGGLDAFACEDVLMSLSERSLIGLDAGAPQAGQAPSRRVLIHDLLHDFVTMLAGDPVSLHNRLLDAYRTLCPNDWSSGPNDGYFFDHLRDHLVEAGRVDDLCRLLLDLAWIEKKAGLGLVFDLARDYAECLRVCAVDDPRRRNIRLLEQAIRRDIHFIARHPNTIFQCLWNSGWWYDCAEAAQHYESADGPWNQPGDRLSALLEAWRAIKEAATPGFVWVRSRRPPFAPLGSAELAVLRGHEDNVECVTVTADGARIISGSDDHTVRVWETATGAPLAVLRGHEQAVMSVAVTPNGTRIISGSYDHTVRVWDAATGALLAVLRGHEDGVASVAVTPDGGRIISGSYDHTVRVWETATGTPLAVLRGHEAYVRSVTVTPDGTRIISGADDRVRVWDAATGAPLIVLETHQRGVWSVVVTPDGARIISGGDDGTVRVWNAATGEALAVLRGHGKKVWKVVVTSDGSYIISGADDDTVRVWDVAAGVAHGVFSGHESGVTSVAVTPDGARIISCSFDLTIRVWDAAMSAARVVLRGHGDTVRLLAVTPDGGRVISSSDDRTVRVWDAATGTTRAVLHGHEGRVVSVTVTPDGGRIISGSDDGTVRVWDTETGAALVVLRGHERGVWRVAMMPDVRRIVSGSDDGTVRVWDAATGEALAVLRGHEGEICSVAVTPDGSLIISGGEDGTVRVWDAAKGAELAVLRGHEGGVFSVAVSPDRTRFISGDRDDGTVRVWDAATGAALSLLRGHKGAVRVVAVTPDGANIISSGDDNQTRVWDLASGVCLEVIRGIGDVRAIAAGYDKFPFRALGRVLETVIDRSASGHEVAHFPGSLWKIVTDPSSRAWVGVGGFGNHMYFITLEGDA